MNAFLLSAALLVLVAAPRAEAGGGDRGAGSRAATASPPEVSGGALGKQIGEVPDDLALFALRDRVFRHTPGGRRATELFYTYIDDMVAAIAADPQLVDLGREWLRSWQQPLRELVAGRGTGITLGQAQVESLLDYVAALKAAGSPELAAALEREESRMGVASWAGLTMDQFLKRVDRLSCAASDTALCLNRGRFRVEAEWRTAEGATGRARAVPLTDDTGYFWFFDAANVEGVVKVLDGCGVNDRFWVFGAGLTDVEVVTTVTDTETGEVRRYDNPQGTPFQPVQDTGAFATCFAAAAANRSVPVPSAADGRKGFAATAPCVPGPETLCLNDGRFRVEAAWTLRDGSRGEGQAVPLTDDTGYFWFFGAANVEEVVKVLDGCGINDRFWVFGAGLTNVRVVTTVTDTVSGRVRTYSNPQGNPFQPIQDTGAFASCR